MLDFQLGSSERQILRQNSTCKRFIGETAVKDKGEGSIWLEEPDTCERRDGRKNCVGRVSDYSVALRKSLQDQGGIPGKGYLLEESSLEQKWEGGHKQEADQREIESCSSSQGLSANYTPHSRFS